EPADGADAGTALERVTLATLPKHHDVALERDALTGFLQYGHRIDPELFARAVALPFRHPGLEAIRAAVAEVPDPSRPGWAMTTIEAVREPYRTLAGELLARPLPASDESGAVAVTGELARNLIVRSLDREKNELLGAVQRVPADSSEGRDVRVRLRDLDAERQRLLAEQ
ncbi:MAG TPA: DNA primase, partial [Microbacterium sp.]|nr:DNA primase [Microbacterium sp.]